MRQRSDAPAAAYLAAARTFLFVPGDRPDRFDKAHRSGADVVVLDLEDAVAPADKPRAREHVVARLVEGYRAVVRVNAPSTPWGSEDAAAVGERAVGVIVPKASSPQDWAGIPTAPVLPLIETAVAFARLEQLLADGAVVRPLLGTLDLAAELGVDPDDPSALLYAKSRLVIAAAAAGTAPPVDGVTTVLDDPEAVEREARAARRLGFTGKLCIHPAQIDPARRALAPTEAELEWARTVVASADQGATAVDGRMVDAPVIGRARQLLALDVQQFDRLGE